MTHSTVNSQNHSRQVYKIVLTGGPCGGKTTALKKITEHFSKRGINVLTVPETATELILGGITPTSLVTSDAFQQLLLELQLKKEELFSRAAQRLKASGKVLIIYDRGILDSRAYMTKSEAFDEALKKQGLTDMSAKARYDGVFHMITVAKVNKDIYDRATVPARTEAPNEAILLDDRTIEAWTGHPHFHIISKADFDQKLQSLIDGISSLIGELPPVETERKFLIEYPDLSLIESLPSCHKFQITQTYLKTDDGSEARVRMKNENGFCTYTKTVKKKISDIQRREYENNISYEEYVTELLNSHPQKGTISKTRYCFSYKDRIFEIDIYPFMKDEAIMEVELEDSLSEIAFPKEIKIIREVTGDNRYKNSQIAQDIFTNSILKGE